MKWLYIPLAYGLGSWFVNELFVMSLLFCIKPSGRKKHFFKKKKMIMIIFVFWLYPRALELVTVIQLPFLPAYSYMHTLKYKHF